MCVKEKINPGKLMFGIVYWTLAIDIYFFIHETFLSDNMILYIFRFLTWSSNMRATLVLSFRINTCLISKLEYLMNKIAKF